MLKIKFKPPPHKKYLIFDEHHSDQIKQIIKEKNNIEILHTRFEKLNIFVLIKSLLKFNFKLSNYYQEYINLVRPKFLITSVDNDLRFYLFKCNDCKKVFIQNGKRTLFDIFFELKKLKINQNLYVDKMFVHNSLIAKEYKKYINGDTCSIGSFWSNFVKIKKIKKINGVRYINFISSFRTNYIKKEGYIFENIKWKDYLNYEEKFLKKLNLYLRKKNYKLKILAKYGNSLYEQEKNYYLKFFDNNKIEIIKNYKRNTFKLLDDAIVNIGSESTLLYEAFGRGNKAYFLGLRGKSNLLKSRNFAWPLQVLNKGLFWNNTSIFNSFEKDLDKLIKYPNNSWNNMYYKYKNKIMSFDYNNQKIINYLN